MQHIFYYTRRIYQFSGNILIWNGLALLLIGVLQSVGILLIVPLLSTTGLVDINAMSIPYLSWFFDLFASIPNNQSLPLILAIYVLITIGQGWFSRNQAILNKRIQQGFIRKLREDMYKGLLKANWEFFTHVRKSDIVKNMTTEIAQVKNGLSVYFKFMSTLLFAGIKVILAFLLSPILTIAVLVAGGVLLLCSRYYSRRAMQFGQDNLELSRVYVAGLTDHLAGIKDIKSNSLEQTHTEWMSSVCQQAEYNAVELTKLRSQSSFLYSAVSAVLLAAFIYLLVDMFQSQPAQLLLVVIIFSRIWPVVRKIQSGRENLANMIPSFEALSQLQKQCEASEEMNIMSEQHVQPLVLHGGLTLRNVSFRYNRNDSHYALQQANVHFRAHDMIAIVGPSGAGKTTMVDILLGLNRPEQGEVLVDGKSRTDEMLLSLRRSISYVAQEPFLFNASVRENLQLIAPNATDEQLWESLADASADEVVRKLPDGLDTFIGDRGVRLSGGERQRLVLARALLRRPSILILDEATSALDSVTERKIQLTLERLRGTMTIIIIAHRLSTIRHADHVVVVDQGRIVQQGAFSVLAEDQSSVLGRLLVSQSEAATG